MTIDLSLTGCVNGAPVTTTGNARLPPELAQVLEKKVAQGLASAKAGKLVDSEVAIKRLHTRLDKLEKALGAGEPPSPLGPTALSACSS